MPEFTKFYIKPYIFRVKIALFLFQNDIVFTYRDKYFNHKKPQRPDVTKMKPARRSSSSEEPLAKIAKKSQNRDSDTDHVAEITQLKEKIAGMQRTISSKNNELLAKAGEITAMKAKLFNEEKLIKEKMKKQQKIHDDKVHELNQKINSLQSELSRVRREANNKAKAKASKAELFPGADKKDLIAHADLRPKKLENNDSRTQSPAQGSRSQSRSPSRSRSRSRSSSGQRSRSGSPKHQHPVSTGSAANSSKNNNSEDRSTSERPESKGSGDANEGDRSKSRSRSGTPSAKSRSGSKSRSRSKSGSPVSRRGSRSSSRNSSRSRSRSRSTSPITQTTTTKAKILDSDSD